MSKNIRFIAEIFDPETDIVSDRTIVMEKEIQNPKNLMELGFTHSD